MSNDHGAAYWCDQYHQLDAQSKAKILELEQRVKVLTDALKPFVREARDYVSDGNKQLIKMVRDGERALNQTPQQTAAQIERGHIEWMMKLPVAAFGCAEMSKDGKCAPVAWMNAYPKDGEVLVAIPQLPESNSPETDLDEALRRQ